MREASKIVDGLGQMLSPMCEVVLHDLSRPNDAIIKIVNDLSGRSAGEPATELGLARIADPTFPDILANYENQFSDGRPAKSTSIGLKDSDGNFVAAICLNMDVEGREIKTNTPQPPGSDLRSCRGCSRPRRWP